MSDRQSVETDSSDRRGARRGQRGGSQGAADDGNDQRGGSRSESEEGRGSADPFSPDQGDSESQGSDGQFAEFDDMEDEGDEPRPEPLRRQSRVQTDDDGTARSSRPARRRATADQSDEADERAARSEVDEDSDDRNVDDLNRNLDDDFEGGDVVDRQKATAADNDDDTQQGDIVDRQKALAADNEEDDSVGPGGESELDFRGQRRSRSSDESEDDFEDGFEAGDEVDRQRQAAADNDDDTQQGDIVDRQKALAADNEEDDSVGPGGESELDFRGQRRARSSGEFDDFDDEDNRQDFDDADSGEFDSDRSDSDRSGSRSFDLDDFGGSFSANADGRLSIDDISDDGLAAQAGFENGDEIVSVNGQRIASDAELRAALRDTEGGPVEFRVRRGGRLTTLQADLGDSFRGNARLTGRGNFGLTFSTLGDDRLLVSGVADGSLGSLAGLRSGDEVIAVDGRLVASQSDFLRQLRGAGGSVPIRIWRDGRFMTVNADLEADDGFSARGQLDGEVDAEADADLDDARTALGGRVEEFGLFFRETEDGLVATRVLPGSSAARGGVQVGDRILSIEGTPVLTEDEFFRWLEGADPESTARFRVMRDVE